MSSTERQATGLRGGPLNERLQVLALLTLTVVTAVLAVIVLLGLSDDDRTLTVDGDEPSAGLTDEPDEDNDGSTSQGVPSIPRVVFIGDEWAQGAGATGPEQAFPVLAASQLGWSFDVDGVEGSGWTTDSPGVPDSRFVDRAARLSDGDNAPDVVVFSAQTPSGSPLREVADLIDQTVETVRTQVPGATIVVVLPVANSQADLLCPPAAEDLICIDTFAEGWLTPGDRAELMNTDVRAPNDAGHARLAGFLAKDLRSALPGLAR